MSQVKLNSLICCLVCCSPQSVQQEDRNAADQESPSHALAAVSLTNEQDCRDASKVQY